MLPPLLQPGCPEKHGAPGCAWRAGVSRSRLRPQSGPAARGARPAGAVHTRGAWPTIATPTRVTGRLPAGAVAPNDLVPGPVAPVGLSDSSVYTFRHHHPCPMALRRFIGGAEKELSWGLPSPKCGFTP